MIVQAPALVLTTPCLEVYPNVVDVPAIAARLHEAMAWSATRGRPAAGLAAPQIGEPFRIFVIAGYPHAFVNPTLLRESHDSDHRLEGCLSLPADVRVAVRRAKRIKLRFQEDDGTPRTIKMHGLDARAALHELDHIDGILITDRHAEQAA